jgi:hypothetical protein
MPEEQKPHSFRHQSGFHLRDYTNFQNSRYRSAENPMSHHEKTIHDAMLSVLYAMSTIKINAPPPFFSWESKFTPICLLRLFFCGVSTRGRVMISPYEASRSHSLNTPHSVGLLWTSHQPYAETSTWRHTTLVRQISMSPAGFEPGIPESEWRQINASHYAANGISLLNNDSIFSAPFQSWDPEPFFLTECPNSHLHQFYALNRNCFWWQVIKQETVASSADNLRLFTYRLC